MKSIYPRIYRRKHSFYIRVSVPKNLQLIIKKKEIIYSLRTNDYYKGLKKGRRHSYFIDNFFKRIERLKMKIVGNKVILSKKDVFVTQKAMLQELLDKSPTYDEISAKRFYALIDRKMLDDENIKNWFINYLEKRIAKDVYSKDDTKEIKKVISKCKKDKKIDFQNLYAPLYRVWDYNYNMEKNRLDQKTIAEAEVIEKLRSKGITPAKNHIFGTSKHMLDNKHIYEAFMMKKKFESTKEIEMLLESIKNDRLKERDTADVFIEKERETLKNCLDHFFEEKRSENRDEEGIKKSRKKLNKMFDWVKIKYIDEIEANDCRKIDRLVRESKNENNEEERISDKTISDRLSLFKGFLRFCRKKQYIVGNLDDIIEPPTASKMNQKKIFPYTDEELEKLFTSSLLLESRYDSEKFQLFWISIIALYTGCRLNEICQLNIDDIIIENGIKCFNITIENDNNDKKKRLKNKYSERKVPIHPFLIKIGFLDFYEKVKNSKDYVNKWFKKNNRKIEIKKNKKVVRIIDAYNKNNLFFTLSYTLNNKHGGKVSNSFSKIKKELFPDRGNLRFHSLRHSFITNLANCNVSNNIINDLTGHTKKGQNQTYIGKERIKVFNEAIEKLSYPSIENKLEKLMSDPKKEKSFIK